MSKVYILVKGNVEGIQEIRAVYRNRKAAVIEWRKFCDELILEIQKHINYELDRNPNQRWIDTWDQQIEALKTYDEEIISDALYPNEFPYIIESELK